MSCWAVIWPSNAETDRTHGRARPSVSRHEGKQADNATFRVVESTKGKSGAFLRVNEQDLHWQLYRWYGQRLLRTAPVTGLSSQRLPAVH